MAKWESPIPRQCNVCDEPLIDVFIDGSYNGGPWTIMCEDCHSVFGSGLGIGHGQKYSLKTLERLEGGD